MKIKVLLLMVILCTFFLLMYGCGQRTAEEAETAEPPSETSISSVVPEASSTAEAPESSSTPVVLSTPAVEESEPEVTTPLDQALEQAKEAFSNGYQVYLYDPQPKTVSEFYLDATEFSLRYILSNDTKAVTNVVFIWKVNAEGAQEYVIADRGYIEDWISETGEITFNTFNIMREVHKGQSYSSDTWAMQAWIGMTPLYARPNQQFVDDPVYIDVFLVAPEENDGNLLVSDSPKHLSNTVRIPIASE